MATRVKKLEGNDRPSEYQHVEHVFRVQADDGSLRYFEDEEEAARAAAALFVRDREENG